MDPNRVGGAGKVSQHLDREPTGLEATNIEEIRTENALATVSKVRSTQEDVDVIAAWLSGYMNASNILPFMYELP